MLWFRSLRRAPVVQEVHRAWHSFRDGTDRYDKGMKRELMHRHTYRDGGSSWAVLTPMDWLTAELSLSAFAEQLREESGFDSHSRESLNNYSHLGGGNCA